MKLGAILVLIGVILVVLDFGLGRVREQYSGAGLLHAGVLLIGIGVLIGHTQLSTT